MAGVLLWRRTERHTSSARLTLERDRPSLYVRTFRHERSIASPPPRIGAGAGSRLTRCADGERRSLRPDYVAPPLRPANVGVGQYGCRWPRRRRHLLQPGAARDRARVQWIDRAVFVDVR